MGWLIGSQDNGRKMTHAEEKAHVTAHYTFTNADGLQCRAVQVSGKSGAWYVAAEVTAPADHNPRPYVAEPLADGRKRYTFAEVLLTRNNAREWGYKAVSEASGPNESNAPRALLALLSPLMDDDSAKYAHAWRARCTAPSQRAAFKDGDAIRLLEPVTYNGGIEAQEFRAETHQRRGRNMRVWRVMSGGFAGEVVRLPKWAIDRGYAAIGDTPR
jgi:hypothetical protein